MANSKVDKEVYKDLNNFKNIRRKKLAKKNLLKKEYFQDKAKNGRRNQKLVKTYKKWDDNHWD
ncbi:hypothetical protein HN446_02655 [bacterium]|nr:hypothetical protein [bacterium]